MNHPMRMSAATEQSIPNDATVHFTRVVDTWLRRPRRIPNTRPRGSATTKAPGTEYNTSHSAVPAPENRKALNCSTGSTRNRGQDHHGHEREHDRAAHGAIVGRGALVQRVSCRGNQRHLPDGPVTGQANTTAAP